MTFAAGSKIGKYVLRRRLGHGGFGVVMAAHDTALDREVALKFLKPEHAADPQVVQRFLREARAAAKVVHPGIVTIYEASEVRGTRTTLDGTAFIAMELLAGESLLDRRAKVGRMTAAMAIDFGRQLASALDAAHRAGIVHRDLKPENIYLVPDSLAPGGERVKVFDFGIAKVLDPEAQSPVKTQSIQVFGTPRYMSPEQCASAANVDHRSDIYTLGCILFELVAGQPPYLGSVGELIAHHLLSPPPSIRAHVPDLSPPLERLVTRMLAKQPADRPQSMADVQRELEHCTRSPAANTSVPLSGHHRVPTDPRDQVHILPAPTTLGSAARSRSLPAIDRAHERHRKWIYFAATVCVLAIPLVAYLALRKDGEPARVASASGAPGSSSESRSSSGAPAYDTRDDKTTRREQGDTSSAAKSDTGSVGLSAETKPAETKPADTKPADTKPADTKPADTKPADPKPADPKPADTKPAGSRSDNPRSAANTKPARPVAKPAAGTDRLVDRPGDKPATGTLAIRVKPDCEIYIDGKLASPRTSYRELVLATGRHQVTLINRELKIEDRFVIETRPGHVDRVVKQYGDKRDATINPFAKGSR